MLFLRIRTLYAINVDEVVIHSGIFIMSLFFFGAAEAAEVQCRIIIYGIIYAAFYYQQAYLYLHLCK